jgi:benzoylformate decarboxylase
VPLRRPVIADIGRFDFVALAKGYGVTADRISKPSDLSDALRKGMASSVPHLIEVEIDPVVAPLM